MKKVGFKCWLGASVSALTLVAMTTVVCAQDAAPAKKDEAPVAKAPDTLVVITARRKALQSAIQIKKNSDTIVDSIVADEAGNLPDASITEVLQRVSGVTVTRFSIANGGTPSFQVEGSGITVRGLPYNSSTLNGRQAFSANGASSLSWGDVTPELMGGVDVYKASRADIMEGGASAIDLRTRLPFDYKKPAFELSAGASYGDLSDKVSPSISGLVTRRFDTKWGEMGLLVDLAHSENFQGSDDSQMGAYLPENNPNVPDKYSLVPTGYSWTQSRSKRARDGFYAAFQWRPNDNLTLTSTYFFSKNTSSGYGRSGGWGVDPTLNGENIPVNATYDSHGAMLSGSTYVGASGIGKPVFGWGGNNWLYDYWNPTDPNYSYIGFLGNNKTILNADCRSQYGSVQTSSPNINWGNWDSPGMFFCQPSSGGASGTPLMLGAGASASKGASSTMDFSQSFVWAEDNMRVRGALQLVKSEATGTNMSTGITQSNPNLTSASFDVTGDLPVLGGFNAAALADTKTAYFNSFAYNGSDNTGSAIAANFDVDYNLGDDHFFKSVSYGGRVAVRSERDNFIGTYWAPIAEGWVTLPYPDRVVDPNNSGQTMPDYGGYAPYIGGGKAITGPYTVQGDSFDVYEVDAQGNKVLDSSGKPKTHSVKLDTNVTPYDTVKASDYELYSFPNFMGKKDGSPGTVLSPSLSLVQSFDWAHLAGLSADAMSDAVNAARCAAETKALGSGKAVPYAGQAGTFSGQAVACDSNPGHWTPQQYYNSSIDQGLGITNTRIKSKAFYVETKFGTGAHGFIPAFTGNFGVRVVSELLLGDGNFNVNQSDAFYLNIGDASQAAAGVVPQGHLYQPIASSVPRSKQISYERVLPSFNIKFDVSPKQIVRFAASQGVSQPNLGDVRAGGTLQPTTKSVIGNNSLTANYLETMTSRGTGSDMKPVTFTSYDASFEWYPKDGAFAYIDVFAKDIKNQDLFSAYYQTQATPLYDVTAGVPVTVDLPWFYIQNRTTSALEKAKIRGVELGGRTFFDMLPAPFDGFGISGNLTYVDSHNPAQLANSTVGTGYVPDGLSDPRCNTVPAGKACLDPSFNPDFTKLPYYGMSKWTYNLELYYSKGPFNVRVAYNWHTKQLMSTNANPLSYIGRGGGAHICTAPACVDSQSSGRIWDMVPLYSDDAGYLDFSMDYKLNSHISFGIQAGNLTNTKSRTLQEPLPGVFELYDTYVSDQRVNAFLRMRY